MEEPKFIISDSGVVIFSVGGDTHSVGTGHKNHQQVLEAVRAKKWFNILPLVPDLPKKMRIYIGIYLDTFELDGPL